MNITSKDLLIITQSQTQRALEITTLLGFPERVKSYADKVKYITEELTPYLVKKIVQTTTNLEQQQLNHRG